MNMTGKILAVCSLSLASVTAVRADSLTTWYWTGEAGDGKWNNKANWLREGGSKSRPAYHAIVVFTNDAPFLLDFDTFGTVSYENVRKFKFMGTAPVYTKTGLVISGSPSDVAPDVCAELHVQAGAEVVCSNSVFMYNSGSLWKTGGGIVRFIGKSSRNIEAPSKSTLTIAEGEWIQQLESGENYGTYNKSTNVVVEAGAVFEIHGYNSMDGAGKWRLDGTLRLNTCGGSTKIGTLTGTGRVEKVTGASSSPTLILYPGVVGPQTFSGTFGPGLTVTITRKDGVPDADFVFPVAHADMLRDVSLSGDLNALRFASGVGDFFINVLTFSSPAVLGLEDADGGPANVHAGRVDTPANMTLTGGGDFCVGSSLTLAGCVVANTGRLVMEKAAKLTVGDGTAAKDVDLSSLAGIVTAGGDVEIRNTVKTEIASLSGAGGNFQSAVPVSFGDYAYQGCYAASSAVTIGGGLVTNLTFAPGTGSLTVSGGVFHAKPAVCAWPAGYANTKLPQTAVVQSGNTALTLDGGEVWLRNNNGDQYGYGYLASVLVNAGAAFYCDDFKWRSTTTADSPDTLTIDGGTFVIPTGRRQYDISLPFEGADGRVRFRVGAGGARILTYGVREVQQPEIRWRTSFEPVPGVTDGGIAFFPRMSDLRFFSPVKLSGGMSVTEGRVLFDGYAELAAAPEFFGTGDFTLTDTVLNLMPRSSDEATLRIAKDATFAYRGNVSVSLRASTTDAPQHIEVGSLAAAGSGSALIVSDASADLGSGSSSFRVLNGLTTGADGLVAQPIVLDLNNEQYLAAYDGERGLVRFTNEKTAAAAQDGDVIGLTADETLAGNTVRNARALRVKNWATLNIPATSRINLGDGTNPALVLINHGGISGAGTLDFGASEGVVAVGHHPDGTRVDCVLAGRSGVSYVTRAAFGRFATVSGANVYEGPTRITSVCVRPTNPLAFSTGDVYVRGGERNGGKIQFQEPLTFANGFHVSGWGHQMSQWYDTTGGCGALTFQTNDVVLAGNVEIVGQVRMSAEKDGDLGILSGRVSGGTLTVYKGSGAVRLTGDNVHTGGTEVVSATLELATGTGAGTGRVLLDAGVLRFVNTAPITFANEVTGVGTVVFAGTAPVTLTGASFAGLPFRTFAAGTSLDVANAANNVYRPHLTGDVDLKGLSLTVAGVSGSGTVSNGRLTVAGEIQPGGPGALGTLAFAEGVLAAGAGAHYVCDIVGDRTDKLEIAGDVDVSAFGFTAVANGRVESGRSVVLSCTGTRSGAFGAVSLPKRWMSLDYGADAVVLNHLQPGLVIIFR